MIRFYLLPVVIVEFLNVAILVVFVPFDYFSVSSIFYYHPHLLCFMKCKYFETMLYLCTSMHNKLIILIYILFISHLSYMALHMTKKIFVDFPLFQTSLNVICKLHRFSMHLFRLFKQNLIYRSKMIYNFNNYCISCNDWHNPKYTTTYLFSVG